MPDTNLGFYRVFAINVTNKRVFVLDPTVVTGPKGERLRRCARAIEQIEENITSVVKLNHPNYADIKTKPWEHFIADNVPGCSR